METIEARGRSSQNTAEQVIRDTEAKRIDELTQAREAFKTLEIQLETERKTSELNYTSLNRTLEERKTEFQQTLKISEEARDLLSNQKRKGRAHIYICIY